MRIRQKVGSVAFMSPEIVQNKSHDHSTDVWSLGVILYGLLTGYLPFINVSLEMTQWNIVNKEINLEQSCWDGVPQKA